MERKVDKQVAAPAEMRTPNLHRATTIAQRRVRMEGWRQWRLGGRKNLVQRKNKRTHLTPTGLLMEGDYTNYDSARPACTRSPRAPPARRNPAKTVYYSVTRPVSKRSTS